jgi:hypothetical protein
VVSFFKKSSLNKSSCIYRYGIRIRIRYVYTYCTESQRQEFGECDRQTDIDSLSRQSTVRHWSAVLSSQCPHLSDCPPVCSSASLMSDNRQTDSRPEHFKCFSSSFCRLSVSVSVCPSLVSQSVNQSVSECQTLHIPVQYRMHILYVYVCSTMQVVSINKRWLSEGWRFATFWGGVGVAHTPVNKGSVSVCSLPEFVLNICPTD